MDQTASAKKPATTLCVLVDLVTSAHHLIAGLNAFQTLNAVRKRLASIRNVKTRAQALVVKMPNAVLSTTILSAVAQPDIPAMLIVVVRLYQVSTVICILT